ncbi:hypothetical protein [Tuwongella immobilis]|uniref:Uncharacterized protein n=1 Tax=Tuwongella immobilis TaxID=692036 RepID=A0A6C2YIK8_9BACT|nr:hypothetical protein [Tuwongella immobilis]VIP01378.1 unnamed protein product [Tuwongella immobilis]VTR98227.1 unnamed protein product [Tuwongella immobilis]
MMRWFPMTMLMMLTLTAAWGCSRQSDRPDVTGEALRKLENRNQRLESDMQAAGAQLAILQQQLLDAETTKKQLQGEVSRLLQATRERDDARTQLADAAVQLKIRTSERDALQSQFENFRKALRTQLEQADVLLKPETRPAPAATTSAPSARQT